MENKNIPPRRTRSKSRLVLFFFLLICFVTSAVAGALLATSSIFDGKKKPPVTQMEKDRENPSEELIKASDKATILIMGVDVREDDVGRSDTLMVATVDPHTDQTTLLSIPRDTRVRIYGYGFDKINAAYAYGGEPLTEKTVENLLGIDIDHYVMINVRSFVKIIDAIGGVDIYVPKRMYYEDPWDDDGGLIIDLYPGRQHMDGKTAVTYVRYRDEEGDIGRVKRQQQFMEACMDKVTSPEIIVHIPDIIREVMYAIDTDMSFRELLELAGTLKAAKSNGLVTDMVPGYPLYIDDVSYWIPDVEEIRFAMAEGLGVSVDSSLRRRAERDADEYNDSIPDNAVGVPDSAGNIVHRRENSRRNYDDSSSDDNYHNRRSYTSDNDSRRDTTENSRRDYTTYDYSRDDSSDYSTNTTDDSRSGYQRDYSRDDTPRRYDERNYSNNRTDSDRRVYDDRNYSDSRSNDNFERYRSVDEPFDVPRRNESNKTRN
ncbi:MAG: LCP family protein [Selenomonadaceae bacterium]|nr:LCP family protein [Selenomonadaceae bacterium]